MEFGAHVSSAGGIDTAIDRLEAIGGDCAQVFTQSPRMWRPTSHKPEAIERFKSRRAEAGVGGVVCHALYLCNLAAPDDDVYEKSIATMRATVDAASAIEADAVIFHVGSHLGAGFDVGLERVVAAMTLILDPCEGDTWLLMENSAGAGGTIGRSVAELATLVDALDRHPRLGICLDSCHLYASGYDVTDPSVVAALVAEVDETIGLDRLRALHVNDSAAPLGSNRDRHANILEGELGEGLGAFLAHPAFQELAAYLEVPGAGSGPDENELRKVRELHARWTAADV
jgi:deoxyribonuclease IV